jgi:hypothetical protein
MISGDQIQFEFEAGKGVQGVTVILITFPPYVGEHDLRRSDPVRIRGGEGGAGGLV